MNHHQGMERIRLSNVKYRGIFNETQNKGEITYTEKVVTI